MNHDYSSLKILYATNTRMDYLAPVRLAPNQINCGPMWPTRRDSEGRYLSLNTSFNYDLAELIANLPVEQRPDLVVVRTCAEMANAPRNLAAVECPKVLLLADTHWQHNRRPIHTILTYLGTETYDHVVMLYDPHHAHWLRAAGVGAVHYLPGFEARPAAATFSTQRNAQVVFTGAARAGSHPRRRRLLGLVRGKGLPVRLIPEMHLHGTAHFSDTLITCHSSLNGELGVDVVEALGAGAFLLADRLSPESGMDRQFRDGEHLVCYDSPADLLDKIGHYLAHPDEAIAIARQGYAHCAQHHAAERRAGELLDLVFRGEASAAAAIDDRRDRVADARSRSRLMERADLYDLLQMAHGESERISVLLYGLGAAAADLADLPRLRLALLAGSEGGREAEALGQSGHAGRIEIVSPQQAQAESWNALIADLSRPGADPALLAQAYRSSVFALCNASDAAVASAENALAGSGFRRGGELAVFVREMAAPRQAAWRWS